MRRIRAVRIDSKPIRRGAVYCSRQCGGGMSTDCTYAAYLVAAERARATVAVLGRGWRARVWDNLGWHWAVHYGSDTIGISMSEPKPGHLMLIVNGYGSGGAVYHGRSARAVLRRARRDVQAFAARIVCAAGAFPQ